jgi:hypothetical protein
MKVRNGFVSNSSSSSFVIQKEQYSDDKLELILSPQKYVEKIKEKKIKQLMMEEDLTREEVEEIINHEAFEYVEEAGLWEVDIREEEIGFYTVMDNFLWDEYINEIKNLKEEDIKHILEKE